MWFWDYTTQKTNGRATTAEIGADGYVTAPANCYAMLFQNSAENETEGSGYTDTSNIIDFSNLGEYGTDTGSGFNGITDLTGIAYFKNIATLNMSRLKYVHYASRSQLSSVDLSGNTKLTTLNLAYNSLASIDLSANTALTSVTLTGNGRTITPLEQDVNGCKTYYIPLSKLEKTLGDGFKVAKLNKTTLSGGEITTINGEEAIKFVNAVVYYNYANGFTGTAVSNTSQFSLTGKASDTFMLGDVNCDGRVDVSDVTTLVSKILGEEPTQFNPDAANVNADQVLDVSDVTSLVSSILAQ